MSAILRVQVRSRPARSLPAGIAVALVALLVFPAETADTQLVQRTLSCAVLYDGCCCSELVVLVQLPVDSLRSLGLCGQAFVNGGSLSLLKQQGEQRWSSAARQLASTFRWTAVRPRF